MDGTVFYWVGGALVAAALVLSFIGIRGKAAFPPSHPLYTAVIGAFALLVVVTGAYAVANAREEQEHRDEELAHEAEEAAEAEEGAEAAGAPAPPGGESLDLTSPADGGLSFEPAGLDAKAGAITLAYENPSAVPHSVAIEDEAGQVLDEGETLTEGTSEATAELAPGEFTFFCTVPGHREGGMEGTLTVSQ